MTDEIKTAFEIVAAESRWCDAFVCLNGYGLSPSEESDLSLLRLVVQHPPIRRQLEEVRDMLVEVLAA